MLESIVSCCTACVLLFKTLPTILDEWRCEFVYADHRSQYLISYNQRGREAYTMHYAARSTVFMVYYHVQYSRPVLSNSIRGLLLRFLHISYATPSPQITTAALTYSKTNNYQKTDSQKQSTSTSWTA